MMGVPKLYSWISKRYPACVFQIVKDGQIPNFDNFYIDMNDIIHVCSRAISAQQPLHDHTLEERLFSRIFTCIETLFNKIKPKKLLFLAIDGVAPRAKMNCQRSYRFSRVHESLPSDQGFDLNCISAGTLFMARFQDKLKDFIKEKLSSNPTWQKVEILLSGHDVPGEGEHKIMDYIRYRKAQPDYDYNTRHCVYGHDADLIVLGLVSHEPHFSIMRKEVDIKRPNKYCLLHLSILREYLGHEFTPLKDKLSFHYDLEMIIDDWVLMTFLIGNDFLPAYRSNERRVLSILYTKYVEVLPQLDGYINEQGTLNLKRFEAYLNKLAWRHPEGRETQRGDEPEEDEGLQVSDGGCSLGENGAMCSRDTNIKDSGESPIHLADIDSGESDDEENDEDSGKTMIDDVPEFEEDESTLDDVCAATDDETDDIVDESKLKEQAQCYIVGIQWMLHYYYYSGVPSWSWFYPYYCRPNMSYVIKGCSEIHTVKFEVGFPLYPFEQLLAILPPESKSLLPEPYHALMVDEVFITDSSDNRMDLIPIIDEGLLTEATKSIHLSDEEAKRNSFGFYFVYSYDSMAQNPSPRTHVIRHVTNCHIKVILLHYFHFNIESKQLVLGLCDGVKLDVHFPGFPSLKHVPHSGNLIHIKREVEPSPGKMQGDVLTLTIPPVDIPQNLHNLARQLIGKVVYIGWPYLTEAKVHSISDGVVEYSQSEVGNRIIPNRLSEAEIEMWKNEKIINKQGIEVGDVKLIVYAWTLKGKWYDLRNCTSTGSIHLHKLWATNLKPFPYETVVRNIEVYSPEFPQVTTLQKVLPPKCPCFILTFPHYGSLAEVVSSVDHRQVTVNVPVHIPIPDLASIINNHTLRVRYTPSSIVREEVGLHPRILSCITGYIRVVPKDSSYNEEKMVKPVCIGLHWKSQVKRKEVPGYVRITEKGWLLSSDAVEILKHFKQKFPIMFEYLQSNPLDDLYCEQNLFPDTNGAESLTAVLKWLKQLPSYRLKAVDCGSYSILDAPQISAMEKAILNFKQRSSAIHLRTHTITLKPGDLFKPVDHRGVCNVIPDPDTVYRLFNRVVNVSTTNNVPFGLRGTVIGIFRGAEESTYRCLEILFDEEFPAGQALRGCSQNRAYRLPPSSLLNITHGNRSTRTSEACMPHPRVHSSSNPPLRGSQSVPKYSVGSAATHPAQSSTNGTTHNTRRHGSKHASAAPMACPHPRSTTGTYSPTPHQTVSRYYTPSSEASCMTHTQYHANDTAQHDRSTVPRRGRGSDRASSMTCPHSSAYSSTPGDQRSGFTTHTHEQTPRSSQRNADVSRGRKGRGRKRH